MFDVSDRSCSLSLAQINNLGSDLSLASTAKIARSLQVFVLTKSFLSIRFTRKVYSHYNAMYVCHMLLYVELNKLHVRE